MAENRCPLIENCQQKSAVCNVQLPDETCYWFRWFRALDNPWHTGTPTEEGRYLVQHGDDFHEVLLVKDGKFMAVEYIETALGTKRHHHDVSETVVAWQKIEPYKED